MNFKPTAFLPGQNRRAKPSLMTTTGSFSSLAENAAGSGFSRTALTRLKIAVLAPMPRASVTLLSGYKSNRFN